MNKKLHMQTFSCPLVSSLYCFLPSSPRPRGFSLVELVISLAILTVGLVGAMRVFPVGLRVSQRAEARSRAVMVAQRTLELMKIAPWETLREGEETTEAEGFTVTTSIRAPEGELAEAAERVKRVEVAVSWIRGGKPQAVRVLTYLRRQVSASG
jgi:prepilin-type N-terminal cleavage/methylation domain-containing protein